MNNMEFSSVSMIYIDDDDDDNEMIITAHQQPVVVVPAADDDLPPSSHHRSSVTSIKSEYFDTLKKLTLDEVGITRRPSVDNRPISNHEINILNVTFNIIKESAAEIGLEGMKRIIEDMPQVAEKFRKSPHQIIRTVDNWELMSQGVMFLSGVERFISRIGQPDQLSVFAKHLATGHGKLYGVTLSEMSRAMTIFEAIIVAHLLAETSITERLIRQLIIENSDEIKAAWHHFIKVIAQLINDQK